MGTPSLKRGRLWYRPVRGKVRLLLVAATSLMAACAPSGHAVGPDRALADTLKQLIAQAYDFSRPGAETRMTSLYPDSGRVISASGGQVITTVDSLRKSIATFWNNVGHNMRNAHWQWDSVYVYRLGPDAAVLTGTWQIPHIAPNNQPHVVGGAWTAVFRRVNGRWKIVHEHLS